MNEVVSMKGQLQLHSKLPHLKLFPVAPTKQKSISQLKRTRQVVSVLAKYGFEDIITHPPLNRLIPPSEKLIPRRQGKSITAYTRFERIRMVCEELGTTFIKFAQIASNRPDLLPDKLIVELTKLQDAAPKVPEKVIKEILENEFGNLWDEMVESFDPSPIASASMAQVHRAVLTGGKEVVLKIQRPNIAQNIKADISILKTLAEIVNNYFPKYAVFQPLELVKVFEKSITKELKFNLEAVNLTRFARQFKNRTDIYVPSLYKELSNKRVLCMEYIEGVKINNFDRLDEMKINRKLLAQQGIDLYFEQIFEHGFYHADPHPGNIFVMENGKLCFLDFGMMGTITRDDKQLLEDILFAFTGKNAKKLKSIFMKMSDIKTASSFSTMEEEINDRFSEYSHLTMGEIHLEEVTDMLNLIFFKYKIKFPPNLLLLFKVLVIVEGVGRNLDPDFKAVENLKPYLGKIWKKEFNPKQISQSALHSAVQLTRLIADFPEDAQDIIHKIKEGKLRIEFEHKGLDKLYKKMEITSNRLSVAIVLAALLMGSSLIILAKTPPFIFETIPLLGFIGLVIAGIVTIRLVLSIWNHENF